MNDSQLFIKCCIIYANQELYFIATVPMQAFEYSSSHVVCQLQVAERLHAVKQYTFILLHGYLLAPVNLEELWSAARWQEC